MKSGNGRPGLTMVTPADSLHDDDETVLNPHASVAFEPGGDGVAPRIRVTALLRNRGWRTTIVTREESPALFAALEQISSADQDVELDEDALAGLRAVGLWVHREEVAGEAFFSAPLEISSGNVARAHDDVIVHPGLTRTPPPGVEAPPSPPDAVAPIWIADARTGMTAPWATGALDTAISSLVPGEPAPPTLDADTLVELRCAGVLVTSAELQAQAALRKRDIEAAARGFTQAGWAPLRELVPPAQLRALQQYYRTAIREGRLPFGDSQVPLRDVQHDEPVARLFLTALTGVVQSIVGAPLKPAYAHAAAYREGAVPANHRDRAQCEWSVAFLVDYEPEPRGVSPWPLWLHRDTEDRGVAAFQHVGEGILYRGTELYHSRDALPPGHCSTHLFLHYVHRDFDGSID
jgi:hypothetical protein